MFEAAQVNIEYGFKTLGLKIIYWAAVPENKASIAVLKKIGMTPDASFDTYGDVVDSFSMKRATFYNDSSLIKKGSMHHIFKPIQTLCAVLVFLAVPCRPWPLRPMKFW